MQAIEPAVKLRGIPADFLTFGDPFTEDAATCRARQAPEGQGELAFEPEPASCTSLLEPVTIVGADGSEMVIDEDNRVRSLRDGAERTFRFGYDLATGELNQVNNEQGCWLRQMGCDGRYLNKWRNVASLAEWTGIVHVDRNGYSYQDLHERICYKPNGTVIIDHLNQGDVFARTKEDRFGNLAIEDLRSNKMNYLFTDGRSAVRDLKSDSLLGYDQSGNLTVMRDALGHRFEFACYDSARQPHIVVNECGRWERVMTGIWRNEETGQTWNGEVHVDHKGAYTFTEASGKKVTRDVDGVAIEEYGGIWTRYQDGSTIRHYTDGQDFLPVLVEGNCRFTVRNGITSCMSLVVENASATVVHGHDQIWAAIKAEPGQAVTSFQDGMVVYSSRFRDERDHRSHPVANLEREDMEAIEKHRRMVGNDQDIVVVQCYDKAHKRISYEIYSGFNQANVVTGDRVTAGQPIGRLGQGGTLNFSVRRNAVSGAPVSISIAA